MSTQSNEFAYIIPLNILHDKNKKKKFLADLQESGKVITDIYIKDNELIVTYKTNVDPLVLGGTACGVTMCSTEGYTISSSVKGSTAIGIDSFAVGNGCNSNGVSSVAMGNTCNAIGEYSFATGGGCNAKAHGSTAMGLLSNANGEASFSIGQGCESNGGWSIATGAYSNTYGDHSVAMGQGCNAKGDNSVAMGDSCTTTKDSEFACGNNNKPDAIKGQLFSIGNDSSSPLNLFAVGEDTSNTIFQFLSKGTSYKITPIFDKGAVTWSYTTS